MLEHPGYDVDSGEPIHPKDDQLAGTYDPLETAKLAGAICALNVKNAGLPLSEYDAAGDHMFEAQTKGLPVFKGAELKPGWALTWEEDKFRFFLNNGHNTIGRWMLSQWAAGLGKGWVTDSCTRRAKLEATRVLLACNLYRNDHAGQLPASLSDLVPKYLPGIPLDPFNGKPMLYSAVKKSVWSVGEDLIDNAGDFSSRPPKDIGVSLALTKPHAIPTVPYVRPPAPRGILGGPPGGPSRDVD